MHIKFYIDEDVPLSLTVALKNRGVDVLTTQEMNKTGTSDREQIDFAVKTKRVLFTHNKIDFIKLHAKILEEGAQHYGIIVTDQLPIGVLLKRTMKCWFTLKADEMINRLEFLSNWR